MTVENSELFCIRLGTNDTVRDIPLVSLKRFDRLIPGLLMLKRFVETNSSESKASLGINIKLFLITEETDKSTVCSVLTLVNESKLERDIPELFENWFDERNSRDGFNGLLNDKTLLTVISSVRFIQQDSKTTTVSEKSSVPPTTVESDKSLENVRSLLSETDLVPVNGVVGRNSVVSANEFETD
jgi:hypothetical protein